MAYVDFAPHDLTSYTSHSPFVVSASSELSQYQKAWQAFDGNTSNYWISSTNTGILTLDIGAGSTKRLYSYDLFVVNPAQAPKDWTMEGSLDGSTWNTLDTRVNQTTASWYQLRSYTCATYTANYRYFRINITGCNGPDYVGISELSLYYDTALPTGGFLNRNYFWESY